MRDSIVPMNAWKRLCLAINHHTTGHNRAGVMISGNWSRCGHGPSHLRLHLIEDLRVIEVQCQQPHQCLHGLTGQKAPSIPIMAEYCRETRGHMKINLPIFKDEEAKDVITYQSWRWDLTVYHHAGCQDHILLPLHRPVLILI